MRMNVRNTAAVLVCMTCFLFSQIALLQAQTAGSVGSGANWPTRGWAKSAPASVGVDEKVLAGMDADLASGKYPLVDSFAVFRCGGDVFERTYFHDYGTIYAKE